MKRTLFFLILVAVASVGWHYRAPIQSWIETQQRQHNSATRPQPKPQHYQDLRGQLESWRQRLQIKLQQARSHEEKQQVLTEARQVLETTLPEMMRCWLGTPWDFNGTAEGPGQGKIACGYYVSTVLRDAGFQVERFKLAQQPSGNILRSFVSRAETTINAGMSYSRFLEVMANRESGIYIVGLDTHVGFIVNRPSGIRFIHSSGRHPYCVVDEGPEAESSLSLSNYRIFGNITANQNFLSSWLEERPFPTHTR